MAEWLQQAAAATAAAAQVGRGLRIRTYVHSLNTESRCQGTTSARRGGAKLRCLTDSWRTFLTPAMIFPDYANALAS